MSMKAKTPIVFAELFFHQADALGQLFFDGLARGDVFCVEVGIMFLRLIARIICGLLAAFDYICSQN